mmetsp:Transcript_112709/g.360050  ORF Transcript_112709/g.360050 Transcript_112709/m.360050 type:complete len:88 (+) Transcript_112709:90-353(+)
MASTQTVGSAPSQSPAPEEVQAAPDAAEPAGAAGPSKSGAIAKGRKLLLAALKSGDAGRLLDQQARAEAEAAERTGPVAGEAGGGSG